MAAQLLCQCNVKFFNSNKIVLVCDLQIYERYQSVALAQSHYSFITQILDQWEAASERYW